MRVSIVCSPKYFLLHLDPYLPEFDQLLSCKVVYLVVTVEITDFVHSVGTRDLSTFAAAESCFCHDWSLVWT